MFLELNEAIARLLDAQTIIENEARGAFGDDKIQLRDISDQLDEIMDALKDIDL